MIETLFQYSAWANARVFKLADGLSDEQLDSKLDLGLGTLRATMHHIWAAEQIWLERWQGVDSPIFHSDASGVSMQQISERLSDTAAKRQSLLEVESANGWSRVVAYRDLKNNQHASPLSGMLMHVANHGVHHRAQALHFLKQFDRKAAGGIDYLFFRIAHPSTPLITRYIEPMRRYGMEADTVPGAEVIFRPQLLRDYFEYHDWAIEQLLQLAKQLEDDQLHAARNMGVGSIHQTLSHLRDAERWWLGIWSEFAEKFPKYDPQENLDDLESSWRQIAQQRNSVVATLDDTSAAKVVVANLGALQVPFRVIESMVQLCCHGTHHRAQVVNMLRQSGVQATGIDYIVWLRSRSPDNRG